MLKSMDVTKPRTNIKEGSLPSPTKSKHIPAWIIILLLCFLLPLGLFFMVRETYYHRWFPILLWIFAVIYLPIYFIFGVFILPQLQGLFTNLGISSLSLYATYFIFSLGIFVLVGSVFYGFVLQKHFKIIGVLSRNQLLIAVAFLIVDMYAPAIFLVFSMQPIYTIIANIK